MQLGAVAIQLLGFKLFEFWRRRRYLGRLYGFAG
jgi:hypothetical protein